MDNPIIARSRTESIPQHPISRDVELEQRTLDALEAAYETAILAELERESREDVL